MKKSAYYSDILFAFFLSSICLLCLLRFFRVVLLLSCLVATLGGVASALFTAVILREKREKSFIKAKDEALKEKFLLHLALLPQEELTQYLSRVLACQKSGDFFTTDAEMIFPIFRLQPIAPDCLLPIFQPPTQNKKVICNSLSPESKTLCERLGVQVIEGVEFFQIAKEKNCLPTEYVSEEFFTQKKKERLKMYFAKSNSRRFFVGGTLVLLSSLITPFPYYYLVVGFLLMGIALFTRIFGAR